MATSEWVFSKKSACSTEVLWGSPLNISFGVHTKLFWLSLSQGNPADQKLHRLLEQMKVGGGLFLEELARFLLFFNCLWADSRVCIPGSNYFPFQESLMNLDVEMRPGKTDPSQFEKLGIHSLPSPFPYVI